MYLTCNVAPSFPHIELLSYCTAPLKLKNEVCMSMSSSGAVPVSVLPVSRSVRHLLSKRPPQVIATVRKEKLGRWLDNIFREAPSQLVTSCCRPRLPAPRSVRSIPTTRSPARLAWRGFIHSDQGRARFSKCPPYALLTQ